MQITNSNYSTAFGKTPVMKCTIKNAQTKRKEPATLYQMNTNLKSDYSEVMNSKNTLCIKSDFERDFATGSDYRQYYLLKNDKTDEVAGCAETTQRMTRNLENYTMVEEISENKKYANGIEPVLTYLVHNAKQNAQDAVVFSTDENVIPDMKKVTQQQAPTGERILSSKMFNTLLNHAEKRYNVEYNA